MGLQRSSHSSRRGSSLRLIWGGSGSWVVEEKGASMLMAWRACCLLEASMLMAWRARCLLEGQQLQADLRGKAAVVRRL